MTRPEKVAWARELRGGGLTVVEIAERMGVARSTAGGYLKDPDLSKQRARRARYSRPCSNCGAPTDGSGGYTHPRRLCAACAAVEPHSVDRARRSRRPGGRRFSNADLLEAIRDGDQLGIRTTLAWRKHSAARGFPSYALIVARFNSWNRARALAGVPVTLPHRRSYTRLSAGDCITAVATVWCALGETPTSTRYNAYVHDVDGSLPSAGLIRIRVGSWFAALESAAFLVERELVAAAA